jgi:hypothetical protein
MPNEFAQVLKDAKIPDRILQRPLQILEEFCAGVEEATEDKLNCTLESGFITELGQEWRVMARSSNMTDGYILLRAHVPGDGFPVQLDFYDEELIPCANESALRKSLTNFLKQKTTQNNLTLLLQHAKRIKPSPSSQKKSKTGVK